MSNPSGSGLAAALCVLGVIASVYMIGQVAPTGPAIFTWLFAGTATICLFSAAAISMMGALGGVRWIRNRRAMYEESDEED